MKKIFLHSLYIGIACILAHSCVKTGPEISEQDGPHIELSFSTSELQTKAGSEIKEGDDEYNENLIKSLDWFIYAKNQTGANAVKSGRETDITAIKSGKLSIFLDEAEINSLVFPRPYETCEIYLIANLPSGTTLPSNTSIENLKNAVALSSDFLNFKKGKSFSFVMDGQGTATLVNRKATVVATPSIALKRIANKFTLSITTVESYKDQNNVTWTPDPTNAWVKAYNLSKTSKLNGDPDYTPSPEYFCYPETARTAGSKGNELTYSSSTKEAVSTPMYSYPIKWTFNSSIEPEFVVMMPWSNGSQSKPYYYKLVLNGTSTEKNGWYHLKAKLSALGSIFEDDPAVLVDGVKYSVADWNNADYHAGNSVDAILKDARYLVIPDKEFRMDNTTTLDIEYSTSHPCELFDIVATRIKFSSTTYSSMTDTLYYTPTTENLSSSAASWFSLKNSGAQSFIHFEHALMNDVLGSKTYDYAPYNISLKIRHKDEVGKTTYIDSVKIVQYPAMYISNERNSKGHPTSLTSFIGRTAIVNNYENYSHLGSVPVTLTNTNGNMYVVTTTSFNSGNYIISDPRATSYNILPESGSDWTAEVNDINGTKRHLIYYYPTDGSSSNDNSVSPKFRVASSWGISSAITYYNAVRRCASYQEDGYPAGRWRVPTKAEVMYLIKLSTDKTIPVLFGVMWTGTHSQYWCNSGYIDCVGNGSADPVYYHTYDGEYNVRCVYDEWYWENMQTPRLSSYNTFTWGDINAPIK